MLNSSPKIYKQKCCRNFRLYKIIIWRRYFKIVNYFKKYSSIIELDNNYKKDNFAEIYETVDDTSLLFNIDNEDFCYKTFQGEIKKIENIVQLIKLKNKIPLIKKKKKDIKIML